MEDVQLEIHSERKFVYLRDSLSLIPSRLANFKVMFGLEDDCKKEVFPYQFYTLDRLKVNKASIDEACLDLKEEERDLFRSNLKELNCMINEKQFDLFKYAEYYCERDVEILRKGFIQFRKVFKEDFNLDPIHYITICSLANAIFEERVYSRNHIFRLGGIVRDFVSKAIRGGRCMTRENKKWHVKEECQDFDGVSLYPSAIARLEIPLGYPQVIIGEDYDFLSDEKKCQCYVVEIEILKVGIKRQFPLMSKTVDGILQWTNEMEGEKLFIDKTTLEDLIKFQEIEFRIIRGYYWNHGVDTKCQKLIKEIFEKRKQLKKDGNPLNSIYKLIMNSVFGKTIQKPITEKIIYRTKEQSEKWLMMNYAKHIETQRNEDADLCEIRFQGDVSKQFNLCLIGVLILSMSKRIMNEVMCLGEDIGCQMYYQDTDSIHIRTVDIPPLVKAFKEEYGRDLIGSDLGQFHSDFTPMLGPVKKGVEVVHAVESIFVGKKFYLDVLELSDGSYDLMFRGKGLTEESIIDCALKRFPNKNKIQAIKSLYLELFEGKKISFNLLVGKPSFDHKSFYQISSRKEFVRTINGENVSKEEEDEGEE
jgi:hypothetical protein